MTVTPFVLCSPVIPENSHHPDLPAQSGDHVHHSAPPLVLHGGHEQRPGITHRWRPQHRSVSVGVEYYESLDCCF